MATYKLDDIQNPDKVFLIKRSELENRWDSKFYNNKVNFLNSFKYPLVEIKKHFIVKDGDHDKLPIEEIVNEINGKRYIRAQDIKNGEIISQKPIFISEKYFNKIKRCHIYPNDLLISIMASLGLNAIVPENFPVSTANRAIGILRNKTNNHLLTQYLQIIIDTEVGFRLFEIEKKGGIQERLNLSDLGNVKIPIPPKEIQQQIVNIYNQAYTEMQAKEAEAQALLGNIDSYLLNELGITLPEQDHSLAARIFTSKFSEVLGGRMDPKLYDNRTKGLINALKTIDVEKYKLFKLKDLITQSVAGDWGIEDEGNEISGYTKCLVIRATEFDNDYNLKLDNSRTKYRLIKNTKLESVDVKENDLLIEKSGGSPDQPVGRIAILEKQFLEEHTLAYSNFIHKISLNEDHTVPQYVFSFLKTIHNIKLTEAMQSQTNGIRNLIMRTYLNQDIIIPIKKDGKIDLQRQNEIAGHIQGIRNQAKALKSQAVELLENAKQQVEQMILG